MLHRAKGDPNLCGCRGGTSCIDGALPRTVGPTRRRLRLLTRVLTSEQG